MTRGLQYTLTHSLLLPVHAVALRSDRPLLRLLQSPPLCVHATFTKLAAAVAAPLTLLLPARPTVCTVS